MWGAIILCSLKYFLTIKCIFLKFQIIRKEHLNLWQSSITRFTFKKGIEEVKIMSIRL